MEDDVALKPILSKESLLSTLWSDGLLLNTTVIAPSPSKDFCQLLISDDETVIRPTCDSSRIPANLAYSKYFFFR